MGDDDRKIGKQLDKLIMGIILGGAIGSVLGLTMAPRKGEETREMIKQKTKDFVRDHKETIEGAKYQLKKGHGFLRWLFKKNKTDSKMPKAYIEEDKDSNS